MARAWKPWADHELPRVARYQALLGSSLIASVRSATSFRARACRPRRGAARVGVGVLGIELDGLCVVGDRGVELLFVEPEVAERKVELGISGVELDRCAIVVDGLVLFAALAASVAAEKVVGRVARSEADCRRIISDGLVVVLFLGPHVAASGQPAGVLWFQVDRFVDVAQRGVELICAQQNRAAITPGDGTGGIETHGQI